MRAEMRVSLRLFYEFIKLQARWQKGIQNRFAPGGRCFPAYAGNGTRLRGSSLSGTYQTGQWKRIPYGRECRGWGSVSALGSRRSLWMFVRGGCLT
jgi:hypothetical protein